jgi:hypothetical protein
LPIVPPPMTTICFMECSLRWRPEQRPVGGLYLTDACRRGDGSADLVRLDSQPPLTGRLQGESSGA